MIEKELEKLLNEGRHIEFVERLNDLLNDLDRKIQKAKQDREYNTKKELERKKEDVMNWCNEYIQDNQDKEILKVTPNDFINYSCVLGVYLAKKQDELKATQIRKILDRFNAISIKYNKNKSDFNSNDVIKLKPIMAYTSARNKSTLELVRILDDAISKVRDGEEGFKDFNRVCEFLMSVVAYHKLAGGKDV